MENKLWPYSAPGIPDEMFLRGTIPMTKEEIRTVTLAKARPAPEQIVWDIGAGTGSLSVEMARLVPGGTVFAVEKDPRGIELIIKNARRFGLDNVVPVEGEAPAALLDLPPPHRIFIGGSGGHLEEILEPAMHRLLSGGRIVANAVTLETAARLTELRRGWRCETVQLQVSRAVPAGNVRMWQALNPVSIIALEREMEQVKHQTF